MEFLWEDTVHGGVAGLAERKETPPSYSREAPAAGRGWGWGWAPPHPLSAYASCTLLAPAGEESELLVMPLTIN